MISDRCERCKELIVAGQLVDHEFCAYKETPAVFFKPYASYRQPNTVTLAAARGAKVPTVELKPHHNRDEVVDGWQDLARKVTE